MTSISDVASHYVTLFTNSKTSLTLDDVFYGDQDLIPGPRTVCVEPSLQSNVRTRSASAKAFKKTFTILIYVYINRIQDEASNRAEADDLAGDIETAIYNDTSGYLSVNVDTIECGLATKPTTGILAACKLTLTVIKEEIL